jgi:putative phosphoesterase
MCATTLYQLTFRSPKTPPDCAPRTSPGTIARQVTTIGLISDTHGLLRPEAVRALAGVRHIIHAGDIGGPEILDELRKIAPVHAVRGNNDKGPWAAEIPLYLALKLEGVSIHVLHDVKEIDVLRRQYLLTDPAAAEVAIVVSGHSHKPTVIERDGVTFVNPGSAGPRRFTLPISVGYLDITTGGTRARIIEIL